MYRDLEKRKEYKRVWQLNNKEKSLEYRKRHRLAHNERSRLRYRRNASIGRDLINNLKNVPCTDCGVKYPTYVMDFDHLDPSLKLFRIGSNANKKLQLLEEEIRKCDVVCSNCHRKRTHYRKELVHLKEVI